LRQRFHAIVLRSFSRIRKKLLPNNCVTEL
jgi:hypothetical protein